MSTGQDSKAGGSHQELGEAGTDFHLEPLGGVVLPRPWLWKSDLRNSENAFLLS